MSSGRIKKAKQGQRQTEALAAIAKFESSKTDWGYTTLGKELGLNSSQARALVATLTMHGQLEARETLVKKTLFMLTPAGRSAKAA